MPERTFVCSKCGKVNLEFQSLMDETIPVCCQLPMLRDYVAETTEGRRPTQMFRTPIEMYSIALNPEEIGDFKRRCPDVEVAESGPMMGVPIARTRQQKLRALKVMGFEERN
jgi:hypothetical protein